MTTATATPDAAPVRRRPRPPDPRSVAFAAAVLVFIAAILAVSDNLARVGAQSLIARALQRDLQLANRPHVRVHGVFFLPQVVEGVYDHVEVEMGPIQDGSLQIFALRADLERVHLRFHDVLVRSTKRILIEHSTERVVLRYSDIDSYLKSIGSPVSVRSAGAGQVRFTGTVSVLGADVSVSADARVGASGSTLYISPTRLDTGLAPLDSTTAALLGQRLTVEIPLQQLPFAQTLTGVQVESGGLTVLAAGRDIAITPSAGRERSR